VTKMSLRLRTFPERRVQEDPPSQPVSIVPGQPSTGKASRIGWCGRFWRPPFGLAVRVPPLTNRKLRFRSNAEMLREALSISRFDEEATRNDVPKRNFSIRFPKGGRIRNSSYFQFRVKMAYAKLAKLLMMKAPS
jgi:hypothetical protein